MKAKSFDCVRMKHEIQQAILAEFRGLSAEEQRRKTDEMIQGDPVLARFRGKCPRPQDTTETKGRG